ncbi:MAG: type II toxin-antitoxin system HicB family antitoxin [bacterium]|nr:type II toxin-antitoxin system HicB family antitoxin [bacterium]
MKKHKKDTNSYTVVFTPAEEGGYTATVPSLPGCVSEGDSFESAKKNITEAIELYTEVAGTLQPASA